MNPVPRAKLDHILSSRAAVFDGTRAWNSPNTAMTDPVVTACDVYREKPEASYKFDERQLRAFVAQQLSSFLLEVSKPKKVGAD